MLIGIFGTGRNGSSLIGRLLDGLGETYVHPVEERFLSAFEDISATGRVSRLVEQNCTSKPLRHLDRKLSLSELAGYYDCRSLSETHDHCKSSVGTPKDLGPFTLKELLDEDDYTVEEFTQGYLQQLANLIRPDIEFKHYLFKSIETAYLQDYENRFPEMRFIHIMRDPVKVCSSQKRSIMENKSLPASYLGYDWLSCMLDKRWLPHARFLDERQNDARHFVVRYEDLIQNPGREINRMAEQLGVAAPERSTVQTIFHNLDKTSWGGNPSKKNVETPAEVVSDLQERHNYEEVLSPREIDLIAVKTRNLLEQFGYESPSSEATLAKLTFQYLLLDKWELVNWRSPRLILRGLFGILYRRIFLYK